MNFSSALRHNRPLFVLTQLAPAAIRRFFGKARARTVGWPQSHLPSGSRVRGGRHIHVTGHFEAAGPIWLESVAGSSGVFGTIEIGSRVSVSHGFIATSASAIRIGDDCLFGSWVLVTDHAHGNYERAPQSSPYQPPALRELDEARSILIGDRCWIGNGVAILPGTVLGDGVIVGANSVVKGTFPANCIIAGSPARIRKTWNDALSIWEPTKPSTSRD